MKNESFEKDGVIYYASKDKAQSVIEFSRYKQDCRKRALDLAQSTARDIGEWLEKNNLEVIESGKDEKPKTIPSKLVAAEILIPIADKYYNWLISIPDSK